MFVKDPGLPKPKLPMRETRDPTPVDPNGMDVVTTQPNAIKKGLSPAGGWDWD